MTQFRGTAMARLGQVHSLAVMSLANKPLERAAQRRAARAISMRALFCAFFVLGVSSASQAAGRTPEEVIAAFFGPNGIQDKSSYYTGEMLADFKDQPTLGQSLPPGVQVFTRPLPTSGALSVFGVTLVKKGATQDWYAYLSQDKGQWKLAAVRTLALTGIPLRVLRELQSKSQRTPDEEWTLQNLQLSFKSDAELRDFVLSNIQRLEKVVSLANAGQANEALSAAKQIYLSAVSKTETGNIELIIGGIVDNSVGIVFVPDGVCPPAISPSLYIYVERVLEHWYVFKTT